MSTSVELVTTSLSLMKACIGAGIYHYPYIFANYGVVYTVALTLVSCIASVFGTYVYIDRNKEHGKGNNISTLGSQIVARGFRYVVDLVVIVKCIVVAAAYMGLSKTLIDQLFAKDTKDIDPDQPREPEYFGYLLTAFGSFLVTPSILSPTLGKFRYFSYIGTFTVLLIVIFSAIQTYDKPYNAEFFTASPPNAIARIGLVIFGFSCHQAILSIHNETTIDEPQLKILIIVSFAAVSLLYLFFGFINYAAFSKSVDVPEELKPIFTKWDSNSTVTKLAVSFFATSLLVTIPFQLHPAKMYFLGMFNIKGGLKHTVGIVAVGLSYFLMTQPWYDITFVSDYIAKPLNALLCFGFPALFVVCGKAKRTYFDYFMALVLAVAAFLCFASYGVKAS